MGEKIILLGGEIDLMTKRTFFQKNYFIFVINLITNETESFI